MFLPGIVEIVTSRRIILIRPSIPTAALPISAHSIPAIIFATSTKISIVPDILRSIDPTLLTFLPGIMDIVISNAITPTSPVIPTAALLISPHVIPDISLATPTNISNATDILRSILPALSIF